jgi:hypothetical protein
MTGFIRPAKPAPVVAAPIPAPTREDPEVQEARRREREIQRRQRGRGATILTSPGGVEDQPLRLLGE